jgi:deacetoxycephalosporin-C synthase/deacetoxycephalosporin-C hydroxylase
MRWHPDSSRPEAIPLLEWNPEGTSELGQRVPSAGVFYLRNTGIDCARMAHFIDFNRRRGGDLPARRRGESKGYVPLRGDSAARVFGTGGYSDDCVKISWEKRGNEPPDAEFEQVWQRMYRDWGDVAQRLTAAIFPHFGLRAPPSTEPILRHTIYPDTADVSAPLRMAEHLDFDFITLLYQTPAANGWVSLEAQIDGRWVPIPPLADTLVVFLGVTLSLLTRGRVRSPLHRVTRPPAELASGCARTSTILFYMPGSAWLKARTLASFARFHLSNRVGRWRAEPTRGSPR